MCDWISLVYEVKTEADQALVAALAAGRDVCVRLTEGEVTGEWFPRESKRSDSHRLSYGLTRNRITIDGSPARLVGDNNVFGDLHPRTCADRMVRSVSIATGVLLPPVDRWRPTRIDFTQNYDCGSLANVRIALDSLGKVAGGHLKASTFGSSVYWNKTSDLWKAKAYAKGPHLDYQCKRGQAGATPDQRDLADRLLRIEMTIGNRLIKRASLNWSNLTEDFCMDLFREHISKLIPENGHQISSEQQMIETLRGEFGEKLSRKLIGTWASIKLIGFAETREAMSRATFFRHQAAFQSIGLSLGDIAEGKVLPFRPRSILARPVDSWEQMRRVA